MEEAIKIRDLRPNADMDDCSFEQHTSVKFDVEALLDCAHPEVLTRVEEYEEITVQ